MGKYSKKKRESKNEKNKIENNRDIREFFKPIEQYETEKPGLLTC